MKWRLSLWRFLLSKIKKHHGTFNTLFLGSVKLSSNVLLKRRRCVSLTVKRNCFRNVANNKWIDCKISQKRHWMRQSTTFSYKNKFSTTIIWQKWDENKSINESGRQHWKIDKSWVYMREFLIERPAVALYVACDWSLNLWRSRSYNSTLKCAKFIFVKSSHENIF